jgi:hypothetical protein
MVLTTESKLLLLLLLLLAASRVYAPTSVARTIHKNPSRNFKWRSSRRLSMISSVNCVRRFLPIQLITYVVFASANALVNDCRLAAVGI